MDSAVADIVDWLADHPSTLDDVEKLGVALAGQVSAEIDSVLSVKDRRSARVEHSWCNLLATFAWAMSEYNGLTDEIVSRIISAIFDKRKRVDRSPVKHVALRIAAQKTSETIRALLPPLPVDLGSTLLKVRILAILMCPSPECHPAVIKYCVKPLVNEEKAVISVETKVRLMECFRSEWPSDDGS